MTLQWTVGAEHPPWIDAPKNGEKKEDNTDMSGVTSLRRDGPTAAVPHWRGACLWAAALFLMAAGLFIVCIAAAFRVQEFPAGRAGTPWYVAPGVPLCFFACLGLVAASLLLAMFKTPPRWLRLTGGWLWGGGAALLLVVFILFFVYLQGITGSAGGYLFGVARSMLRLEHLTLVRW